MGKSGSLTRREWEYIAPVPSSVGLQKYLKQTHFWVFYGQKEVQPPELTLNTFNQDFGESFRET